jgi:hypothetical protein
MAESLNFSVGPLGESKKSKIRQSNPEIYLSDVLKAIRNLPVSEDQKELLSNLAKKIPNGSLHNFLSNYQIYVKK